MTTSVATLNSCRPAMSPASVAVSWAEMVSHRDYLVRFAQRKLRDPMLAEDAVHDVFEAVLTGRAVFAGRAALRSWLTAVLKHKIVDTVRRHARFDSLEDDVDGHGALALECPQPGPDEVAEQRQLLARALARIDALPSTLREGFKARFGQPILEGYGLSETSPVVAMNTPQQQRAGNE